MMNRPTYREAIEDVRERCEPHDENRASEYIRGMINLIADLWAIPGMDTGTRMDQVERDIFGDPPASAVYPPHFTESDTADAEEDQERKREPEYICDRCGAPKGAHALGEGCNQNCGGHVIKRDPNIMAMGLETNPFVSSVWVDAVNRKLNELSRAVDDTASDAGLNAVETRIRDLERDLQNDPYREEIRALFGRMNRLTQLCQRLQTQIRDDRASLERQLDVLAKAIPEPKEEQ